MAKISVIVPVYQVEKYLEACLNSLVQQTLKDIEILVINDGSTDGSQDIINVFQAKYPHKIKAFSKQNGGLSDARNFGLDRAIGSYIGFVDSDDTISETMFEDMYQLAEKYSAEMVICNLQKAGETGRVVKKLTQIPDKPEVFVLKDHLDVFSDLSYFACNKIFRRDLFVRKRFKTGLHFEDIQLIPQLLLQCTVIAQTQKYHYQYMERADSITKNHSRKGLDILAAVREVNTVFLESEYAHQQTVLKNFNILEGVYTYWAYLAFVKEDELFAEMNLKGEEFRKEHGISLLEIFRYQRFQKNYLLSLPLKKKIYYLLVFSGLYPYFRRLI